MFGYGEDEMIGRSITVLYPPARLGEEGAVLAQLQRGERVEHFETTRRRKDGREFDVSVTISPIRDRTGAIVGASKIARDISRQKRAEASLRQLNQELEQRVEKQTAELFEARKLEAIGRSSGTIAHDFNNILQIVISGLNLLERRLPADPNIAMLIGGARDAAERGARTVQELLSFARQQAIEPRVIDVNAVIREMNDLLVGSAGAGIDIRTILASDLQPVLVDKNQLERAILNLVVNARDAMPEGGLISIETANVAPGPDQIAPSAEIAPGRYVRIIVRDTGIGIPPEIRDRIFEPFFTTKSAGAGTGLGLPMVYGFALQAGGRTAIESSEGDGTAVIIDLPQAEVPSLADRR